ncbi:chymotrypsin-like protease CTRL-1 isoform X1 [Diorhabda carinulata]|uniref:chymotrypsin-like protease CTRL-1 isoform X1 n=1 Tax=Diorhabda carinulata TaxID=1163345 RepID=UPI0025A24498|nr:chymotrypsin-like protease CTRL-1 isoform X1 [Diorhabda carinulata]
MWFVNVFILIVIIQKIAGDIVSPCPKYFLFEPNKSKDDRWYGIIFLNSSRDIKGIKLDLEFDTSIIQLGNWLGEVTSNSDNQKFIIRSDKEIQASEVYKVEIYVVYDPYHESEPPRLIKIKLNDKEICPLYEDVINTQNYPINDFYRPILEVNISIPQCGVPIPTPVALITKGQHTVPGQFPWHAAIYIKGGNRADYKCGGTLISLQHVVTAAHCTVSQNFQHPRDPNEFEVILGKYNLTLDEDHQQLFTVIKVNVHEKFDTTFLFNDIAILQLNKPTQYTKFVRPICLWKEDTALEFVIDKVGIAVGWGRNDQGHSTTELLMQVNMPIISTEECINSYHEIYSQYTNENNFCAGYGNGSSVCNGDSGGGLIFPKNDTNGTNTVWQLKGIVSNTVGIQNICDSTKYVIFTDVPKFFSWITNITRTT